MKKSENQSSAFSASRLSDWESAAREELQGADPWNKLSKTIHGLSIKPYYVRSEGTEGANQLPPSEDPFLGPRRWYNCPRVVVHQAESANKQALEHLQQGADGVLFDLEKDVSLDQLIEGIDWPSCSLNFLSRNDVGSISRQLSAYIRRIKQPTPGALFGFAGFAEESVPTFRINGHVLPALPSPADCVAQGIEGLLARLGPSWKQQAGSAAFVVQIGEDFFVEIAKVRALRLVWEKLLSKNGIQSSTYVHALSMPFSNPAYSPQGNMIKSTTAAMASILGGCDALTLEPETADDVTMSRVARNVSNILREESHFSQVADALAGSYFIEDLVKQISEASWSLLKQKNLV
ncbi:MAG: hypothetical protein JNK10_04555 [Cyclobacteriaceae bacterium]|nr:hypothetical protein [Cyclobacteriaceae bacterium]